MVILTKGYFVFMNINIFGLRNHQYNIGYRGLLGQSELVAVESSGDTHFSSINKYYYPFMDETDSGIEKFVRKHSKLNNYEILGETTYEQILIRPLEKLRFTTKEYFGYKLWHKNKLIDNIKYNAIEQELMSKGLHRYLNVDNTSKINSCINVITKFVREILL